VRGCPSPLTRYSNCSEIFADRKVQGGVLWRRHPFFQKNLPLELQTLMQDQGAAFAAGATQHPQQSLQDLMLVLLLFPRACWVLVTGTPLRHCLYCSLLHAPSQLIDRGRDCTYLMLCYHLAQVLSQARLKPQDQQPS
jgi:hypothetical protein